MPSELFSSSWKQYCNWTTSKGFPLAFEKLGPCLIGVQRKYLQIIHMSQERELNKHHLAKIRRHFPNGYCSPANLWALTVRVARWQGCWQGFLLLLISEEDTCLWLPLSPGWLRVSFLLSGRMSSVPRRSCRQASNTPRLTDSWRRRSMRSS